MRINYIFYHPQGDASHYFSHQSVTKFHSNLPLIQQRIQNARLLGVLGVQNIISTQHWEHGIWKQGLCRCNRIKMRSYWIRVSPYPMTASLLRRGKFEHRHTQRQRLELCCCKNTRICQQLAETRRRQWHPTPVLLLGESHGWRSVVGYSPTRTVESDTTERLHFPFLLSCTGKGNGSPLQYSCLENPRDGSLVGCRLRGHTELDMTDVT